MPRIICDFSYLCLHHIHTSSSKQASSSELSFELSEASLELISSLLLSRDEDEDDNEEETFRRDVIAFFVFCVGGTSRSLSLSIVSMSA